MRVSGFLRGPDRAMRILYFDCFNGASGDMILGALLDAGLPLDALRDALGSLAIDELRGRPPSVCCAPACRRRSSGWSSTAHRPPSRTNATHSHAPSTTDHAHDHGHHRTATSRAALQPRPSRTRCRTTTDHAHRSLPDIYAHIDRSALTPDGKDAREGAVRAAGRCRGGDPSDAGRARPPPRGRRARLDRRHRRRRVRARLVQAPIAWWCRR